MKSSFLPKYEKKIVKISALLHKAEILTIFFSYFGRNDEVKNSFRNCLTFSDQENLFENFEAEDIEFANI